MKCNIKMTVITVCHNAETKIENTICSIITQTYNNLEYIIIDGNSSDKTVEIIKRYSQNFPIKYISENDSGIYNAMNKGIGLTEGEYVLFINAGDKLYDVNVINRIVKAITKYSTEILIGGIRYEYGDGRHMVKYHEYFSLKELMLPSMPCHQSIIAKRSIIDKFNEEYKICADYDWFVQSYKKYLNRKYRICYLKTIIATFEVGGVSTHHKSSERLLKEAKRILIAHMPILYVGHTIGLIKNRKRGFYK